MREMPMGMRIIVCLAWYQIAHTEYLSPMGRHCVIVTTWSHRKTRRNCQRVSRLRTLLQHFAGFNKMIDELFGPDCDRRAHYCLQTLSSVVTPTNIPTSVNRARQRSSRSRNQSSQFCPLFKWSASVK